MGMVKMICESCVGGGVGGIEGIRGGKVEEMLDRVEDSIKEVKGLLKNGGELKGGMWK